MERSGGERSVIAQAAGDDEKDRYEKDLKLRTFGLAQEFDIAPRGEERDNDKDQQVALRTGAAAKYTAEIRAPLGRKNRG